MSTQTDYDGVHNIASSLGYFIDRALKSLS